MTAPQKFAALDPITGKIPDRFVSTTFIRSTDTLNGANIIAQPLDKGPINSVGFQLYNNASSSYPLRGTARTDVMIFWVGPVIPPIGNGYALDNTDQWINTTP
jgi:hypothetical protein